MEATKTELAEKIRESAVSVLSILILVSLLCLFLTPMQPQLLLAFLIGALMLILGMGLFSLGAEQSMTPIGTKIGTALTKTKNLPLILGVSFLLGFAITVAEPDLQVLADRVQPELDEVGAADVVPAQHGAGAARCDVEPVDPGEVERVGRARAGGRAGRRRRRAQRQEAAGRARGRPGAGSGSCGRCRAAAGGDEPAVTPGGPAAGVTAR